MTNAPDFNLRDALDAAARGSERGSTTRITGFVAEERARGVVAAARSSDPNSANSQFFIMFADAPHDSWFMVGAGGHYVWMAPAQQAVVVVRWLDPARSPGFVSRVARALG